MGKVFEYPASLTVPEDFQVLAIMHFYNEADILGRTIEYLLSQGVDVYLVDNWSDDGSYEVAQRYMEKNQGHIFLERFPDQGNAGYYDWYHQLARTEEIAAGMEYSWYIHYDADEMRVGPWKGKNLRQALYYMDQLGFNAVDNTVVDFKLTDRGATDIFMADTYFDFRHFMSGFDQRKTWKRTGKIDLKKTGGHIAEIESPKIFPLKILNRHYPLRSIEQASRKVFSDRKPRFVKEKKERGWHGHYDNILSEKDLLSDKKDLILWDNSVWERYYVPLFLGCGIRIDDKEEFELYKRYLEGKRVILYGAGKYGRYFYEEMADCLDIVAWVDQDYIHIPWLCGRKIQPLEHIGRVGYEAVFIAVADVKVKQEIKNSLVQSGVPLDKIY